MDNIVSAVISGVDKMFSKPGDCGEQTGGNGGPSGCRDFRRDFGKCRGVALLPDERTSAAPGLEGGKENRERRKVKYGEPCRDRSPFGQRHVGFDHRGKK